jgi:hypothetical protein
MQKLRELHANISEIFKLILKQHMEVIKVPSAVNRMCGTAF